MFPFIPLGPFALPTQPLVLLLTATAVLFLLERTAVLLQFDRERTSTMGTISLLTMVVGARLVYVFLHWSNYATAPQTIIWPLTSGYSWWGGLLAALAAIFFYSRAQQWPLTAVADLLTPSVLLLLAGQSLADFLGGAGYGIVWQATGWRHPVQLYELLLVAVTLGLWYWLQPRRPFVGALAGSCTAVYSAGQLLITPLWANPSLTGAQGWLTAQLFYYTLLLLSLAFVFWQLWRLTTPTPPPPSSPSQTKPHSGNKATQTPQ
jgi:phosphatidylglycerol---prolipoprotein diacylglyceryl transferase